MKKGGISMKPEIRRAHGAHEFETPERCLILEVANDAGDEDVSISRARVPTGVTTEWHHLAATDERYIIVSGVGRVEIGGIDAADVGPGDVVRIPADTRQRIANTGKDDLLFFCVCTPPFKVSSYHQ
jgi:mannose-6-phosphate isomerase-like protein (cupin superfamily)